MIIGYLDPWVNPILEPDKLYKLRVPVAYAVEFPSTYKTL